MKLLHYSWGWLFNVDNLCLWSMKALVMNIRHFQIKVIITFSTNYHCKRLIKWWVFFFQLGIYMCRWIFINFMPFIILIIFFFCNLTILAFDQWRICDDFGTSTNQFCLLWLVFCSFILRVHQGFFSLSTYAKRLHFFVTSHIKSTYSYW
jgi:TRAP-type mannitol/chloroaromatic compound transport system permease small subunit